jgi:ATP synthase protein I
MPDDIPNSKPPARKAPQGVLGGLMRAEQGMQIAFALPISVLVGWGIGAALDHWLHQNWIYIAGVVLGAVAGFIEIFQIVAKNSKDLP